MQILINMNKLLYIGSGLHFEPVIHFALTKEFVFVDTLPRSEFDGLIRDGSEFIEYFYRDKFVLRLKEKLENMGFKLINEIQLNNKYHEEILPIAKRTRYWDKNFLSKFPHANPHLLVFSNDKTQQTLKYYISTNILKNMCDELQKDIGESSGLIICGYHPDKIILEYISKPISLICYSGTCYYLDDDEFDDFDNLIYWTFKNNGIVNKYFNKLYVCDKYNDGKLTKCKNMLDINKLAHESWNKHYQENF